MKTVPTFKPAANISDEVTSDKLNALAERTKYVLASIGGDAEAVQGPDGWHIFIGKRRAAFDGFPFKVYAATTAGKIIVYPGTINSSMPTLGGVALDYATPPELSVSSGQCVVATIVTNLITGNMSSVIVEARSTGSLTHSISGTNRTDYVVLAFLTLDGSTITAVNQQRFWNFLTEVYGNRLNVWIA
jgi:hypothetical protein